MLLGINTIEKQNLEHLAERLTAPGGLEVKTYKTSVKTFKVLEFSNDVLFSLVFCSGGLYLCQYCSPGSGVVSFLSIALFHIEGSHRLDGC